MSSREQAVAAGVTSPSESRGVLPVEYLIVNGRPSIESGAFNRNLHGRVLLKR